MNTGKEKKTFTGYGKLLHRCDALVNAAVWRKANDALDSRPPQRPGGNGHVSPNPALLSGGVLFCPECDNSPMYRVACGGTRGARVPYYRCSGRGPQRRGWGNMVRCDRVDAAVHELAAKTFYAPVMVTRIKAGRTYEAELEDLRNELVDLARQGLPWAEEDVKRAELRARYDDLSSRETVPDEVVTEASGQTQTYKELWDKLTDAERGPWLKDRGFRVTADRAGVRLSQPGHPQQVAAAIQF